MMGDEKEREDFYDKEIAPELAKLRDRCVERGLQFLALVEWEPGEYGRTTGLKAPLGLAIEWANWAGQSNGNIDSFMIAVMRQAHERGHSSAVLSMLGVPTSPVKSEVAP